MKHRAKAVLCVTAGFAAVLLLIWGLDRWIVQPAFKTLENTQAREDAARVMTAVRRELQQLGNVLGNWAEWDDAYAFADSRDPAFIRSNLGDWTVLEKSSHINLCLVLARDGQVLYGGGYDSDLGGTLMPAAFSGEKPAVLKILRPAFEQGQALEGVLSTEHGLLLIAAHPILTTRGSGPSRGTLVFGRYLDQPLVQILNEQTQVDFELLPAGDPRLTIEEQKLLESLQPGQPVLQPGPGETSLVFEILLDLAAEPLALIRTPVRQEISVTARSTGRTLIGGLGLAALALLLGGVLCATRLRSGKTSVTDEVAWAIAALTVLIGLTLAFGLFWELHQSSQEAWFERLWILIAGSALTILLALYLFSLASQQQWAKERQRLAAVVFEAAREAIIVTDAERHIVAVNPAFTLISGFTEAEVLGQNPRLLRSGRQSDTYYAALWQTLTREGAWQGEFWNRRKDGSLYAVLTTISQVRDPTGRLTHYVGIAMDISNLKEAEQRIERLAYYDALTDLPNRTLLAERARLALALAARRQEELAVLFLDLDRFKELNDSLGHTEGDALLVQVASQLRNSTRETDTVCRLGGDEFVLLLPEVGREGALQVANKLMALFRQPFEVAGHSLRVTVSIGMALYPHHGTSFDDLLKNADTALYRAKQEGRNTQVFYDREMNVATFDRLLLESQLRRAIEAGQLCTYFQPKVRLSDGALAGAEALVRWRHPEHGMIPPGRFIPVAEASDLIVALGDWVLSDVCRQLARWHAAGLPPLTVAVNLAARHFRDPGLIARVQELLSANGLTPQALELELTESTLLEAGAQTAEALLALKRLGVELAIDDFGTGYSSLAYLKRLPITALKIDQTFVRDLVTDPDDRTLAATIVTLGHSLGLKAVAEGVETEEQRRILLEQGCDFAQGYLFGRPVPAEEFTNWFAHQSVSGGAAAQAR